ncbi:MAG: peptidylprolyl isomerase [Thermoleophilaceae bacterium]|nr:peptidylprolyl isomerase [Thermoleophilaceae bacterium]
MKLRPTKLISLALLLAALALVAAGCGNNSSSPPTDGTAGASEKTADTGCKAVSAPDAKDVNLDKPTETLDASKTHTVLFKTSCGDFTIELDVKNSPKTASSFYYLAENKVFDGTPFHRVVPDFVIQGGDPQGTGTGDAGYKVKEKPASDAKYDIGTVAMAKSGAEAPGTSSSQFFVVTGPNGQTLPLEYAIAGKVIDGIETVNRIAALGVSDGPPSQPVVTFSATPKTE